MASNLAQANDAVHVAAQLGRLDLVSALLAAIGLMAALLAIGGFFYVRHRAEKAAREEAQYLNERIEAEALSKMEEMLPTLVDQYMELLRNSVTADQANDIAEAQGEDTDGDDLPDDQGGPAAGPNGTR